MNAWSHELITRTRLEFDDSREQENFKPLNALFKAGWVLD